MDPEIMRGKLHAELHEQDAHPARRAELFAQCLRGALPRCAIQVMIEPPGMFECRATLTLADGQRFAALNRVYEAEVIHGRYPVDGTAYRLAHLLADQLYHETEL